MCKWIKSGANRIDPCIKNSFNLDLAKQAGYTPLACCCGHGKYEPTLVGRDFASGIIFELTTGIRIPRVKRFYVRDSEGHFYIPEVEMARYNFALSHTHQSSNP